MTLIAVGRCRRDLYHGLEHDRLASEKAMDGLLDSGAHGTEVVVWPKAVVRPGGASKFGLWKTVSK